MAFDFPLQSVTVVTVISLANRPTGWPARVRAAAGAGRRGEVAGGRTGQGGQQAPDGAPQGPPLEGGQDARAEGGARQAEAGVCDETMRACCG